MNIGPINFKRAHPPPPPRAFVGHVFTSPSSRWGICKEGQPGSEASSKTTRFSDFNKSSIWLHSNMCTFLHNCFHLRTRNGKKKNVQGSCKRCSFNC